MNPDFRNLLSSNLLAFMLYMFAANNRTFIKNWHHKIMADALMRVVLCDTKRLIINLPPRYSKTELSVVHFMAWCLGLYPDSEFIHASYSKRLATKNAYNCRALVQSDAYRDLFPDVKLMDDSKAKDEWRTSAGGVVYATGSDGTITGYGAGKLRQGFGGAIIIDDPHKAVDAESAVMRQNVIDWFQNTIESRLNSPDTPIIIIMQRLHEADLTGWLLDGGNGEVWTHVKIPALDEHDTPLWPYKHDYDALMRMANANPYVFAGQYMQAPAPKEGGIIKNHWLQRYHTPPASKIRVVQSWDTAYKAEQINDPSVCTTWLQTANRYYLLDVCRIRADYPAVKRTVISKYEQYRPDAVLIEDKASGQSLIQELRQNTAIPVISIKPDGDKETRLNAVSSLFEAGQVFLPEVASWLPEYESELFLFPMAKHDDQVDSTSQALNWMRERSGSVNYATAGGRVF